MTTSTGRDRQSDMIEKVVYINRVAKVVKGGRRFNFSAVVVIGDGQGNVGAGMGKAKEVPEAIRKGATLARKQMLRVPMSGSTLPHAVIAQYGASRVMLRPASAGTGIIAGGGVRAIMEAAGLHDVLTKSLGSRNPVNVVRATMEGLRSLRDPAAERERRAEAQAAPPPPPPRPRRVEPPRPREPRPQRPMEPMAPPPVAAEAVESAEGAPPAVEGLVTGGEAAPVVVAEVAAESAALPTEAAVEPAVAPVEIAAEAAVPPEEVAPESVILSPEVGVKAAVTDAGEATIEMSAGGAEEAASVAPVEDESAAKAPEAGNAEA